MFALRRITFGLLLLLPLASRAVAQNTRDEFWPEIDGYVNLNSATRLYFLANFNSDKETRQWQADLGAHIDFALKPVLRRELRSHQDVFRKRFLSFRAGFRYITSLTDSGSPYLEHRWVVELTSRLPLPEKVAMVHTSRSEMRFISRQPFSTRYRDKLQLEREFSLGAVVLIPYVNGELYYDTRYDVWNRNRYSVGVQVPAGRHLVLETYFLRQNDSRSGTPHVNAFSLKFNVYL